jgi:hypothetical protein
VAISDVATRHELNSSCREAFGQTSAAVVLHGGVGTICLARWNKRSNQSMALGFIATSMTLTVDNVWTRNDFHSLGGKALDISGAAVKLHRRVSAIVVTLWNKGANQTSLLSVVTLSMASARLDS